LKPTRGQWFFIGSLVLIPTVTLAASKEPEQPDKEMLRMIDFLKDLEVIRDMEMMKDMQRLEQMRDQAARDPGQSSSPPAKKKDSTK
jgi:hypothetical protein